MALVNILAKLKDQKGNGLSFRLSSNSEPGLTAIQTKRSGPQRGSQLPAGLSLVYLAWTLEGRGDFGPPEYSLRQGSLHVAFVRVSLSPRIEGKPKGQPTSLLLTPSSTHTHTHFLLPAIAYA